MKRNFFIALVLAVISINGFSQARGGFSLAVLIPDAGTLEGDPVGVGFYGNYEHDITKKLDFVAETGWANWSRMNADGSAGEVENLNTISVTGGLKYNLFKPIYLEGRTGYYFSGIDQFVVIPAVGLRVWKIDANLGANVIGDVPFINFRLGIFFLEKKS